MTRYIYPWKALTYWNIIVYKKGHLNQLSSVYLSFSSSQVKYLTSKMKTKLCLRNNDLCNGHKLNLVKILEFGWNFVYINIYSFDLVFFEAIWQKSVKLFLFLDCCQKYFFQTRLGERCILTVSRQMTFMITKHVAH